MTAYAPATEAEACDAVAEARAAHRPLTLRGGGTRAGLGRPTNAVDVLSSAGLTGITLYEPSELVIAARAGTPVRVLEEALAERGQRLPVEPPDHRRLYGAPGAQPSGEPTLGGLVAAGASGPRRFAAGALRDHLIGVRFVNGRGEAVKSGGRVMKNVTGLDLVKLQCGAHGTLGFLTEVTFKLVPRPETAATLLFRGLDEARAVAALTRAVGTPFEVTGAAHLPNLDGGTTLLRLEGFRSSVEDRAARLAAHLAEFGAAERADAAAPWDDLRDGVALGAAPEDAVWRVSVAPTRGPAVAARLAGVARRRCFDWAGGLLWLATDPAGDAGAAAVRAAVAEVGGHATLLRAPDAVRAAVGVFEPLPPALRAVTAGIKASFDPEGVMNPGRMYGGV